jgi:mannose-6-phosphate isomerase-like protein (cupin superfamily)
MPETDVRTAAAHRVLSLRKRLETATPVGQTRRGAVSDAELGDVFGAPWRSLALIRHQAGSASEPRKLTDSDVLVFVVAGRGWAECSSGPVDLAPGTSLAILNGEEYSVVVDGGEDLELFCAEMGLPE